MLFSTHPTGVREGVCLCGGCLASVFSAAFNISQVSWVT